jgi:hypothetical protein
MGVGAAALLERFCSAVVRRRIVVGFVATFVFIGTALAVQSHLKPFKHRWDREHQLFARWFWKFASDGVPQLCISDDLGWRLYSKDSQKSYAVQREIYRRGTSLEARHDWHSLPSGTPIDCVTFALENRPRDEAQFAAWMATMERHYRLVGQRIYPIMIDDKPGKTAAYYVWRFEPRTPEVRPDCIVRAKTTTGEVRLDGTPPDPLDSLQAIEAKASRSTTR